MNEDFPCQKQRSNWSCLPFAVQSLLLYLGVIAELDEIYQWCRAGQDGIPGACRWPLSVKGLRSRFPESDELPRGNWERVEESLAFKDPVIVTIADPYAEGAIGDHAVVILEILEAEGGCLLIRYCDPTEGCVTETSLPQFQLEWDTAGGKAFVLRA